MGLIDDVFAPIPTSVLADWGQLLTYVRTATPRNYDPNTGAVTGNDVLVFVKGVILRMNPRETEGLYQDTDMKFIIGTSELGTYYPTQLDRIRYTQQGGVTYEAKIINVTTYRGDNPVMHVIIGRPQ